MSVAQQRELGPVARHTGDRDVVRADHEVDVDLARVDPGAIVFAQSTSSEFGHKGVTDTPLNGVTRNPWNLDRTPGDEGTYPEDDLTVARGPDGNWVFTHKDGRPY